MGILELYSLFGVAQHNVGIANVSVFHAAAGEMKEFDILEELKFETKNVL